MENKLDMVRIALKSDRTYFSEKPIKSTSDAVETIINELKDLDRECFIMLNMDNKGIPINASITSIGELTAAPVHPREAFKSSLLSSAAGVIMMHNHPSGNLKASKDDVEITLRMRACGKLLGIPVMDHIVFSPNGKYFSMYDEGIMANDPIYDDALLRGILSEQEFDYEEKLGADLSEEECGFSIYRTIGTKKVEIKLSYDEMEEIYQEYMYNGISEEFENEKAENELLEGMLSMVSAAKDTCIEHECDKDFEFEM